MEQKVPKHRNGSLRDLAQQQGKSHTTMRRWERYAYALHVLRTVLGDEAIEALLSKRIHVGQEPLYQWYLMTRADPQAGMYIYTELLQHPELTMKLTNDFIRVNYNAWCEWCEAQKAG
jgi:hypothetical protein